MEMSKEDVAKARLWEAFKGGQQYMVETGKNPGTVVHVGTPEGEEVIFPDITDPRKLAGVIVALARKWHAEYVILVTLGWAVQSQGKERDPAAWHEQMQEEKSRRGGTFKNVLGRIEVITAQMRLIGGPVIAVMAEIRREGNKISFGEAKELTVIQSGILRPWTDT